jgi:hypothetical protein
MVSVLGLGETRRYLRRYHARMMVAFFAILYGLGTMVFGGMLIFARTPWGYSAEVLWGNALGTGQWNYPGLLIVAPWGIVTLPFLATWSMVFVSIGVGIGVSVALLISAQLVRDRRRAGARPGAVASVAGLTPAMIALVTLGACCSTTAAATAGVGLVAQASGSTLNNLLVNNWFLDVFQVGVVFVALLAQEMLLRVYGGLFARPGSPDSLGRTAVRPAPLGAKLLVGGGLRIALLLAGVTWSLAMFAEWTTVSPLAATPTLWFQWVFQHQLIAVMAILVALFPASIADALARNSSRPMISALRLGLLLGGLSLATWVPATVAGGGAAGFLNELFGVWGLPASWGAVAPVFSPGATLFARWGFQYLLLGGFAAALAIAPDRALTPVLWTWGTSDARTVPGTGSEAWSPPPSVKPSAFVSSRDGAVGVRAEPPPTARGVQDP